LPKMVPGIFLVTAPWGMSLISIGVPRSHLGHFTRFEIVPRSDAPRWDFLERALFWRERGVFGPKIHTVYAAVYEVLEVRRESYSPVKASKNKMWWPFRMTLYLLVSIIFDWRNFFGWAPGVVPVMFSRCDVWLCVGWF
jgi:hypothetical protein